MLIGLLTMSQGLINNHNLKVRPGTNPNINLAVTLYSIVVDLIEHCYSNTYGILNLTG